MLVHFRCIPEPLSKPELMSVSMLVPTAMPDSMPILSLFRGLGPKFCPCLCPCQYLNPCRNLSPCPCLCPNIRPHPYPNQRRCPVPCPSPRVPVHQCWCIVWCSGSSACGGGFRHLVDLGNWTWTSRLQTKLLPWSKHMDVRTSAPGNALWTRTGTELIAHSCFAYLLIIVSVFKDSCYDSERYWCCLGHTLPNHFTFALAIPVFLTLIFFGFLLFVAYCLTLACFLYYVFFFYSCFKTACSVFVHNDCK